MSILQPRYCAEDIALYEELLKKPFEDMTEEEHRFMSCMYYFEEYNAGDEEVLEDYETYQEKVEYECFSEECAEQEEDDDA